MKNLKSPQQKTDAAGFFKPDGSGGDGSDGGLFDGTGKAE